MQFLKEVCASLLLSSLGVAISLGILALQRRDAGLLRTTELAATVLLMTVLFALFSFRAFYRVHCRLEQLERAHKRQQS